MKRRFLVMSILSLFFFPVLSFSQSQFALSNSTNNLLVKGSGGYSDETIIPQQSNNSVETEYRSSYSCGQESVMGAAFKYCFRKGNPRSTSDLIYFLHGLDGDEQTWFTQTLGTGIIDRLWRDWGYEPSVVTVSFGKEWLLVNNSRYALLPYFRHVVMPFLETKIGRQGSIPRYDNTRGQDPGHDFTNRQGRRFLIGQSMGGFNAAEVSLQMPGLFSRVALLCPAITTVGPFSPVKDLERYIIRTGADPDHVKLMLTLSRKVFIDQKDWDRHDPLKLIARYKGRKPVYFVSTGVVDEYGFDEGSEVFTRLSRSVGFNTWFDPAPGFHCDFDRYSTAKFIMEGAAK